MAIIQQNRGSQQSTQAEFVEELLEETEQLLHIDYETVRRERFTRGVFCPHCYTRSGKRISDYVKYGNVHGTGWQRYRCNHCKRVFSDLTNTFFHRNQSGESKRSAASRDSSAGSITLSYCCQFNRKLSDCDCC
ncbi:hypothetical protein [Paenibacillus sp. HB172176]|uniref:hypothetical protein n=1 Tax=Paenibacillus sp. HB172176 TaxID=2493690 RepID=UPI00143C9563|nr:hypothetical protein [Paenibacillus sp. HB172176]